MEKSNSVLKRVLVEGKAIVEAMMKKVKDAEGETKRAKVTLKVERVMMSTEIGAYKESVKVLEGRGPCCSSKWRG